MSLPETAAAPPTKPPIANPTRPSRRLMTIEVLGASLGSGSPTKVGQKLSA